MEGNAQEIVTNLVITFGEMWPFLIIPLLHLVFDFLGSVSALGRTNSLPIYLCGQGKGLFGGTSFPPFCDQGGVC